MDLPDRNNQVKAAVIQPTSLPGKMAPGTTTAGEPGALRTEELLRLAIERERKQARLAQQQELIARQAKSRAEENAKWAQESQARLKEQSLLLNEQRQWAKVAEARADHANALANTNEQWAKRSDILVLRANERIAELERYLAEHKEWALRCEAEIVLLKNRRNVPNP